MKLLITLLLCALMFSSGCAKRGSTKSGELPPVPSCEESFKALCEEPLEPTAETNAGIEKEDNENAARWAACIVRHAGLVQCALELERLLRRITEDAKAPRK